jgi:hypothetical protein
MKRTIQLLSVLIIGVGALAMPKAASATDDFCMDQGLSACIDYGGCGAFCAAGGGAGECEMYYGGQYYHCYCDCHFKT